MSLKAGAEGGRGSEWRLTTEEEGRRLKIRAMEGFAYVVEIMEGLSD